LSIDKILQNDDGVDSLTDYQLKVAYVRYRLMRIIMRQVHRDRKVTYEDAEWAEKCLKHYHDGVFPELIGRTVGRSLLGEGLTWDDTGENTELLWDRFFKDGATEAESRQAARGKLKMALRQCGMPDSAVARHWVTKPAVEDDAEEW